MDPVYLLVEKVVDYTVGPVLHQVGYLFNYKSNVQNLETRTKDLVLAKERRQHDLVEELRKVGQKTEGDVEKWLTEVNEIIEEANRFLEEEGKANKCLYGFCRYLPCRKAAKLSQKMVVELEKKFPRLTYSTPLQDIWTTIGDIGIESRMSIVTQILEELKKNDIYMIGVYGMGGVGKTTLVKQVARKAEDDKLFDVVVRVEVKQNTDVERIQKEIVEKLGLKFDENGSVTLLACNLVWSPGFMLILEELSLRNLVSLESVCSWQLADDSFKKLKIIKVIGCPKLKNLFSFSMPIREFLELEEIEVENCKNMKQIVEGKEQLVDEENDLIKFHGLRSLKLQSLPELISFSSNHSPLVASTSTNPMQLFNDKVVFPKLEALILSSIPLNKLRDGQLSARLCWIQNLTSLIVESCDGLTFLCSSSMSISLFVKLKKLEIRKCQNMVEIISTQEYSEVKKMSNTFPKLEILVLQDLGNLEKFCTSASYIEFPCLQVLNIKECTKLGAFIVDPIMRKNVIDTDGHYLFDEKVGFPRLESLVIKGLHKLTNIWHTHLGPGSFYELTKIWVISCSSLIHILVPGILKRLHSLKKLYVKDCESVEVVFKVEGTSGGDHNQSEIFIFRNLIQVYILECKSLKNVFPASVAKLLENLEYLKITKCEILEQIVAEEEVGLPPNFIFPRVTFLWLTWLPQLRSFYPGKHTSTWLSLRELVIRGCFKLETLAEEYSSFQQQQREDDTKGPFFLFQKGSFSNLEELRLDFLEYVDYVLLDFFKINRLRMFCARKGSSAVLSVFLQKFHNLKSLQLMFGDMEEIFMNELLDGEEPHFFAHLKSLEINGMNNLVNVWKENSHFAGPIFPNVENLKVEVCGRLKNIVSSAISFHNLVQLEVLKCDALKHLITPLVAKSLVQLQSIIVENCQRMVEIVASSDDNEYIDDADHIIEITFSRLKDLRLSNLPNLKGFCSQSYNVKFPFLTTWSVISCVEMKISVDGVLLDDSKHNGVLQITEEEEEEERRRRRRRKKK